jgi:DNA-binding transcriptional MerR regulator
VRTLHYYDEIGLLHPAGRSAGGYRRYTREELLRLQQILFFRELDVPLADIQRHLDDPDFDALETLERHEAALRARAERTERLLRTISRTIESMRGGTKMLTDNELYDGLNQDLVEQYKSEARSHWPEEYRNVDAKIRGMSKEAWRAVQEEGEAVNRDLAELLRAARTENRTPDPAAPAVQRVIARHRAWLERFYEVDRERYEGLAEMYVSDERFAAFYEKYEPGLADFLSQAMQVCAEAM